MHKVVIHGVHNVLMEHIGSSEHRYQQPAPGSRDVSDRVMMLDGGKIVESTDPETIFTNPAEERTRQFLSAVLSSGL